MLREAPMPVKTEINISSDEDLANTIDNMIERLETVGWRKHNIGMENGPNCVIGALFWVDREKYSAPFIGIHQDYMFALEEAMGIDNLPKWNDRPWRTKGQVIRKLQRTANKLREA